MIVACACLQILIKHNYNRKQVELQKIYEYSVLKVERHIEELNFDTMAS